jgi:hypothetical protein
VVEPGQFAARRHHRVFPIARPPARIELFGEEIDTLRR